MWTRGRVVKMWTAKDILTMAFLVGRQGSVPHTNLMEWRQGMAEKDVSLKGA